VLVAPAFDPTVIYPRLVIFMEPNPAAQRLGAENGGEHQEQERDAHAAGAAAAASPSKKKQESAVDVYLTLPQAVWAHLERDQRFRQFA
jgi:hypothetical protein